MSSKHDPSPLNDLPEAILLDMDGVLADVRNSYRIAILETVKRFGVELDSEQIAAAKRRGNANNDWELSRRILAEHGVRVQLEAVVRCFEQLYQGDVLQPGLYLRETLIPSRSVLETLARRCKLAIVTGRPRLDAQRFLERFEIGGYFSSVVCLEDALQKPDPAPASLALFRLGVSRAWMVGDTPDDMVCATLAGVIALGIVAPGDDSKTTVEALRESGATRVLECFDQLLEMTQ